MIVRDARDADVPALTAIYAHYVRTSHATFDTEPPDLEERRSWAREHAADGRHRLLVALDEDDGPVLGYATTSRFRVKPAYATSVEVSVYLDPAATGRGLGDALYDRLLPEVEAAGVHRCYAGVALPNPASEALHRRHGFAVVGTYGEVGWKLGRWVDVRWYERAAPTTR